MTPITIAHLSDVHLAPIVGFSPGYWNFKRLLGYLNWQRGRMHVHVREIADRIAADVRAQGVDHIAVTGDLANLGLPEEYKQARAWLEALGSPDRVSVVPGNHDIYTKRLFGASCLEDWSPYMTGDDKDPRERFPFVRRVGHVALIGVNSAVPTPPFVAAGQLGPAQSERLAEILHELGRDQNVVRVVMIHHPPLPGMAPKMKELDDSPLLKRILEQHGAELVLHGHNHTDTLVNLETATGPCMISGVPSASAAIMADDDEPLARYHIYTIESRAKIERVSRGLTQENSDIVGLTHRLARSKP